MSLGEAGETRTCAVACPIMGPGDFSGPGCRETVRKSVLWPLLQAMRGVLPPLPPAAQLWPGSEREEFFSRYLLPAPCLTSCGTFAKLQNQLDSYFLAYEMAANVPSPVGVFGG